MAMYSQNKNDNHYTLSILNLRDLADSGNIYLPGTNHKKNWPINTAPPSLQSARLTAPSMTAQHTAAKCKVQSTLPSLTPSPKSGVIYYYRSGINAAV